MLTLNAMVSYMKSIGKPEVAIEAIKEMYEKDKELATGYFMKMYPDYESGFEQIMVSDSKEEIEKVEDNIHRSNLFKYESVLEDWKNERINSGVKSNKLKINTWDRTLNFDEDLYKIIEMKKGIDAIGKKYIGIFEASGSKVTNIYECVTVLLPMISECMNELCEYRNSVFKTHEYGNEKWYSELNEMTINSWIESPNVEKHFKALEKGLIEAMKSDLKIKGNTFDFQYHGDYYSVNQIIRQTIRYRGTMTKYMLRDNVEQFAGEVGINIAKSFGNYIADKISNYASKLTAEREYNIFKQFVAEEMTSYIGEWVSELQSDILNRLIYDGDGFCSAPLLSDKDVDSLLESIEKEMNGKYADNDIFNAYLNVLEIIPYSQKVYIYLFKYVSDDKINNLLDLTNALGEYSAFSMAFLALDDKVIEAKNGNGNWDESKYEYHMKHYWRLQNVPWKFNKRIVNLYLENINRNSKKVIQERERVEEEKRKKAEEERQRKIREAEKIKLKQECNDRFFASWKELGLVKNYIWSVQFKYNFQGKTVNSNNCKRICEEDVFFSEYSNIKDTDYIGQNVFVRTDNLTITDRYIYIYKDFYHLESVEDIMYMKSMKNYQDDDILMLRVGDKVKIVRIKPSQVTVDRLLHFIKIFYMLRGKTSYYGRKFCYCRDCKKETKLGTWFNGQMLNEKFYDGVKNTVELFKSLDHYTCPKCSYGTIYYNVVEYAMDEKNYIDIKDLENKFNAEDAEIWSKVKTNRELMSEIESCEQYYKNRSSIKKIPQKEGFFSRLLTKK